MDAALATRLLVPEHEGMVIACSGTSAAMLAKWHEEVRALKPNKRALAREALRASPQPQRKVITRHLGWRIYALETPSFAQAPWGPLHNGNLS